MAKTSKDLTHLLSPLTEDRAKTELVLADEHMNDEIALRLGRAFLRGRLDKFMGVTTSNEFPFPTADECNLYAGGYQYDDPGSAMDALNELLDQHRGSEHEPAITAAKEISDALLALDQREAAEGLSLQLLEERMDLRFKLQGMTINNINTAIETMMQSSQLMDQLMQLERRPHAKDKPDAD